MPETLLWLIGGGATLAAGWPAYLALRGPQPLQFPVVLAHVTGMLAGYGIIVLVGLMSRTPALEYGVGADRLSRWHARGGRLVVTCMLVHAWAAVDAWASSRHENWVLALWHVLRLPWLIAATLGSVLAMVVAVISVRAARRRLTYEKWHGIHLLAYVAVSLTFMHQLAGPDLAGHRLMQVSWSLLYAVVFAALIEYRIITPLRNAKRHRMRVKWVVPEAPGVVSLIIRGQHLEELAAEPGQFFRWRFLAPELWTTAHPFSMSAPATSDYLRLTVKNLGDSTARIQQLEPGTWIMAEGPYGAMTAARRTQPNVMLIAGGVGITPLRALIQTLAAQADGVVILLYRSSDPLDLIFRHELDEIAAGRRVQVHYLTGKDIPRSWPQAIPRFLPAFRSFDVFFCGPPAMAASVRHALFDAGFPRHQFHEERFDF